jgi:hypothetical protein
VADEVLSVVQTLSPDVDSGTGRQAGGRLQHGAGSGHGNGAPAQGAATESGAFSVALTSLTLSERRANVECGAAAPSRPVARGHRIPSS